MARHFMYKNRLYTIGLKYESILNKYFPAKHSVHNDIINTLVPRDCVKRLPSLNTRRDFLWLASTWYYLRTSGASTTSWKHRVAAKLLFLDLICSYKAWRHMRGYPVNGQRTWSNGKTATKNNTLLKNLRAQQIVNAFGKKRRTKAHILALGMANNRLWRKTWPSEWEQARKFNIRIAWNKKNKWTARIDLVSLSKAITGGYRRRGQASKFNKAKKRFRAITIGLPTYFVKYIFLGSRSKMFPVRYAIAGVVRRIKKKKIKKKVIKGAKKQQKKTTKKK